MQETRVRFLGQEDPLEKEMATRSRILAWRIPWTLKPGRLQYMGGKESDRTERLTHVSIHSTDSHVSRIVCINLKGSEAIGLCHGTYLSSSLFLSLIRSRIWPPQPTAPYRRVISSLLP